jgi:predicted metal-dependent phosphoesterase TrpH
LAQRAAERGVTLWALTDHDEVSGQAEAAQAAQTCGMAYLCGVEVSVSFAGTTVHIVGLGVDPDNTDLRDGLRQTRGGREQRARDMAAELAQVGIANAYEGALQYVGNPELISRAHFARHLVSIGKAKDMPDVFKRYLAEGKPGFVPHRWASLRDALSWIHGAQGVAVVAHPARYGFTPTEEYALFTEFKAHGGRGVEVVTGSHSQAEFATYADIAREFDLLASRGSDFHGPEDSRIDLGGLPDLPSGLTPVWEALQARIQPATV